MYVYGVYATLLKSLLQLPKCTKEVKQVIFSFMCMFCRSLFVPFLLTIAVTVLRFTDSDYSFGIFKLFLKPCIRANREPQFK